MNSSFCAGYVCFDGSIQYGQCQPGYFLNSATCLLCTECSSYISQCGLNVDSVCSTTNQIALIASVVCVLGLSLVAIAGVRWYWLKTRTGASRRLLEYDCATDVPADQQDLPWELRDEYQAVKCIGSGAFSIVLDAKSKKKQNAECAIKLIFASDGCFSKDELMKLDREVVFPLHMEMPIK
jgi:hypothetical protein